MSYAYAESLVHLEDLAVEDHPMTHDLCPLHAEAVRVPRGWELTDSRHGTGSDTVAASGADPEGIPDPGGVPLRLVGA